MVIHDLNVRCSGLRPAEADPPLIVDTNAVLACSISTKRFEAISRWNPKIVKTAGNLQLSELAPSYGLDVYEAPHPMPLGEGLRVGAPKRRDHGT